MVNRIFVNLAVTNLPRSVEFYTGLGFTMEPRFTDDTAACIVVSDQIFVMLVTHEKFKSFTPKPICNSTLENEMLLCLSFASREKVDGIVEKAISSGGTIFREPQNYGFMYSRAFEDLDGHVWELMFMEPSARSDQ